MFTFVGRGFAASNDPWAIRSLSEPKPKPPAELPTAVIHFANGRYLEPHLYSVSVIGRLPTASLDPYLIVGGSDCLDCDENTMSVFIGRPSAWQPNLNDAAVPRGLWFSQYPHRNYEIERRTLWDWSRLFVGRCLNPKQTVVISFGAERGDGNRKGSRWVDWAYAEGDHLLFQRADTDAHKAPSLSVVLRAKHLNSCREVRPITFDEPF